jgi:thiamine-phosphate pyrophosphorylase
LTRWTPPQPLNIILDADAARAAGWTLAELAESCLRGGGRFFQLRGKSMASGALLTAASSLAARARVDGAQLVINDRADVARLCSVDGVHVGQTDLSPSAVRMILGPDAVVGLSTHTSDQVRAALGEPISYLAIGPVFDTATKATGHEPVGLAGVRMAAQMAGHRGVPVIAIGGITRERALDVLEAGAAAVAVIGDLFAGGNPEQRVRDYLAIGRG